MGWTEAQKAMGLDQCLVKALFPDAYICKTKGHVDVRRPRTKDDPPALVGYVLMSGYHLTDMMAWDDAAARIINQADSATKNAGD